MLTFAWVLFITLVVTTMYQIGFAVWFSRVLLRSGGNLPGNETAWPKVAILMSLRGADPQLAETLRRMLNQDYAHYFLRVIVDSRSDAAWPVVEAIQQRAGGRLELEELVERRATCGLQCSAFVQAASHLPEDVEVVVTVDGDLMPHEQWLKELVAPLLDQRVGASFGNRWFMPRQATSGALTRYLWNAAAVVPMCMMGMPWGGCLAIRRSAIDKTGLVDKWAHSIVHDALVKSLLDDLGLKVRFVPSLMMAIRETCDLRFCLDFLKRQMLWTRLYHPQWWTIVLHAFFTTSLWMATAGVAIYALVIRDVASLTLAGGGLLLYMIAMLLMLALMEYSVSRTLLRRHESVNTLSLGTWLKIPFAVALTQFVHFAAVILANTAHGVTWRGVTYDLKGPWAISRVDDRPFEQPVLTEGTEASL